MKHIAKNNLVVKSFTMLGALISIITKEGDQTIEYKINRNILPRHFITKGDRMKLRILDNKIVKCEFSCS
jgi:hypothetical protein